MSALDKVLMVAQSHFVHTSVGSYFVLCYVIDDFGNVVERDTTDGVIGLCRFMEENFA